ncbi:LOW QUALITY PROTEIN: hypothetical protein V1477_018708 [Vespula maculifrons]|uniref:Uncharacterized protein n=1 Tax=Vespula maculifrons TaxID=7453 RepID=A0ABD2AW43_VESMC
MRGFGDSRLTTSTGCCIALKCGSHESKTLLLVVLLKPELALPRPRKETSDSPTPPVVQSANDPHPTALLPGFESSYGKKRIRVSAGTPSSKPHDGLDVAKVPVVATGSMVAFASRLPLVNTGLVRERLMPLKSSDSSARGGGGGGSSTSDGGASSGDGGGCGGGSSSLACSCGTMQRAGMRPNEIRDTLGAFAVSRGVLLEARIFRVDLFGVGLKRGVEGGVGQATSAQSVSRLGVRGGIGVSGL